MKLFNLRECEVHFNKHKPKYAFDIYKGESYEGSCDSLCDAIRHCNNLKTGK